MRIHVLHRARFSVTSVSSFFALLVFCRGSASSSLIFSLMVIFVVVISVKIFYFIRFSFVNSCLDFSVLLN